MLLLFLFQFFLSLNTQEIVIEAEDGVLSGSGVSILTSASGYTGSGYVGRFEDAADTLSVTFSASETGTYGIMFRYQTFGGDKTCGLFINDNALAPFTFIHEGAEWKFSEKVLIEIETTGDQVLKIEAQWGWFIIDSIHVNLMPPSPPKDYSRVVETLINPKATKEAVELYDFLRTIYGKKTLSGHTVDNYDELSAAVGKSPAVIAYDVAPYCPMYAYAWDNGHTFGPRPDLGEIDDIISRYHASNGELIISIQWHWFSPGGPADSSAGTNTFWTQYTSFDVSEAVKVDTVQRDAVVRDIDAIAVELKKLQDENIPILWRPLHEASGGWFWWGAKGEEPLLALWDIVYDRLTNHHELNNLIWIYNSEEWWPGLDKLDMFTYDSYPGAFNYATLRSEFNSMYTQSEGKKLLGVSENGPIPDIPLCFESERDVKWLYFLTWDDFWTTENSIEHLQYIFNHDLVITLDELGGECSPVACHENAVCVAAFCACLPGFDGDGVENCLPGSTGGDNDDDSEADDDDDDDDDGDSGSKRSNGAAISPGGIAGIVVASLFGVFLAIVLVVAVVVIVIFSVARSKKVNANSMEMDDKA